MIQAEGLTKDYGARRALDQLTFRAEAGEIVGFLGLNGAGKTTTMRILSGYMPPTEGSAMVAGYDVVEESLEVRKRVGYLPETVPLYPDMTVAGYLKFMADLRRLPNTKTRIREVLELVHLEDRANGYIANLSKGMRQRVGLAQALIHRPQVLILDEPTIGLDPAQIMEVRKLIGELGQERTVLLSTHILSEVQQVCNRVLIINKGRVVVEDTPAGLQTRVAGGQRVMVKVGGDEDGIEAVIMAVPGVTRVIFHSGSVEFETAAGLDVRPEVARGLVNAGFALLEMRPLQVSFEDIFMKLTRDEPVPPSLADDLSEIEAEVSSDKALEPDL
jgi:ABC-2 type transport system ATP-binding protein